MLAHYYNIFKKKRNEIKGGKGEKSESMKGMKKQVNNKQIIKMVFGKYVIKGNSDC
jgi:hypothetical protein